MIDQYTPNAETWALIDAACCGEPTTDQVERLEAALRSDERLCDFYLDYFNLHAELTRSIRLEHVRDKIVDAIQSPASTPEVFSPPATETTSFPSLSTTHYPLPSTFVGGPVFSYMVASIVLCLMLLGAWAYKINHNFIAKNSRRSTTFDPSNQPELVLVGRITGMKDCRWADPDTQTIVGALVSLDRQYALTSGLLEITYKSGAKVILEGPCTYKVESDAGGYLERGRLTARVDSKGSGFRVQDSKHSSLSTLHSTLFSVRTPTAVVTDLGTEFGVDVDETGATKAHVFQGAVELKVADATGKTKTYRLSQNQSARVIAQNNSLNVDVLKGAYNDFVRHIPKRVRFDVFNTGRKLLAGDADPHWSIAAVSHDPNFKPRSAVVTATPPYDRWLWNSYGRSQWISTANGPVDEPKGTYTFRTQFELADVNPATVALDVAFVADNHVDAIRLNGHSLKVPEHGYEIPFDRMIRLTASEGFVAGTNVLEIDVFNGGGSNPNPNEPSPMGLRVELAGRANSASGDVKQQTINNEENHN